MASATLSALAGSLLSPLSKVSLEKLIGHLWDYLSSSPSPSSPDEAEKQQQLKDSLEELEDAKLNVKLMQGRIMKLFQKHKQNERVVGLHNKLKDVGYDIQDLESEMNYMELERKVQENNKAEEEEEGDSTSSQFSGKRSFPFRLPTAFLSKKKRRLPASSQSSSLSTDEDIVRQVTSILKKIKSIESKLKEETILEELFDQITLNGVYDPREHHFAQNERVTTSSTNERKIYGRNEEIQRLIEFLTEPNVSNSSTVSVVPIVGMGGIGKTTLAQFIFNDREIENHFDGKAWIYVSNHFDRCRITKEMLHVISPNVQCCSTSNLDFLERELQRHLTGKKFLLVLDDIWSDEWQWLLAPLQSSQAQVIKIIATCRDPMVLRSIDERNKIILKGMDHQEYWSLFLNCAFAENNPDNYSQELHVIGRCIVKKLMGSPLAAKTVGKLLGRDLTEKYWNDVLENDLWKLKIDAHDIMPALALSYYHLPPHLQPCFVFCSLLCNHNYRHCEMEELIYMWIANGYIHESGSNSKTLHDIGEEYCHELLAMGFFDKVGSTKVKMHDLMHDLAQLVSHGEICIYKSGKDEKLSKNARHVYVECLIDPGLVFETNNLRTLVLEGVDAMFALFNHGAFKRIRALVISNNNLQEFPDAICHLKHLQYLDLLQTRIKSIPESLCSFYQLRVLKLPWDLPALPSQVHSLINLEILYTGNKRNGLMCMQLKNLNKLRGWLSIVALEIIRNKKEATKAKLNERLHIKELNLRWNIDTVDHCKHVVQEEVLEGLQPHPNLEQLNIEGYMGSKTPSWLMTPALQKLQKIYLFKCRNWACLPAALGLLTSLKVLHLDDIGNITIECDDSMSEMFPSLEQLELLTATVSFKSMSSSSRSLTTPGCSKLFPRLQKLTVDKCDEVNGLLLPKLSTLEMLSLKDSRGLQSQVARCLQNLTSLTSIDLLFIKGLKTETTTEIGAQQQQEGRVLPNLKDIYIECCEDKSFMWDLLLRVPSLKQLRLSKCSPVSLPAVGRLSFLQEIVLEEMELTLEDLYPSLKRLRIWKKSKIIFHNVPSSVTTKIHNCFPCLDYLNIQECDEVSGLQWPISFQLPQCLYGLSSLTQLELISAKIKNFPTEVMATLHTLDGLLLEECNELSSVEGLQALPSLRYLYISNCPKFKSWCMEEMPTLCDIYICSCQDLISLPAWLHRLSSMKRLIINKCPKFDSLPEGGLPSSLDTLVITECDPGLMKCCQQEQSPEWLMIQHIPNRRYISKNI